MSLAVLTPEAVQHKCPVRGHEGHLLRLVSTHEQKGSGAQGATFECPSGKYRWFVLNGRALSDVVRQVRPRWGWRK